MTHPSVPRRLAAIGLAGVLAASVACLAQTVSGVQPESPVLLISEADGLAQMGVKNSDSEPLLLLTQVYSAGDEDAPGVVPLPPVTRVEAGGRQVVRFVLEKSARPLEVQHYRRVTFEGIPPRATGSGVSRVRVNMRYDLPVIISPKGLPAEDAPWSLLVWTLEGGRVAVHNPSRYVVRLSPEIDLLPAVRRVAFLQRFFILPGETRAVDLPEGVSAAELTGVRLFPATLYGYTAPDYDAAFKR